MSLSIRLLAAIPALALAACAHQPATLRSDATCNAAAASRYVGKMADAATADAIREATGAHSARTLKPDDAATLDFRQDRVNILLDEAGRIHQVTCG